MSNNLLPRGTCFPLKRPSIKTPAVSQPLASALDGQPGFFAPKPYHNAPEQKTLGGEVASKWSSLNPFPTSMSSVDLAI